MRELLLFGIMFVIILALIGLMIGWAKFVEWQEQRHTTVKSSRIVMSRAEDDTPPRNAPSSLQTTPPQTDQTPIIRRPPAEELLTVYRLMRKYGIPREEARAALKAANLPLDNNFWTSAAPPAEEPAVSVTPIAGRPTSAEFRDPELIYQPPPTR